MLLLILTACAPSAQTFDPALAAALAATLDQGREAQGLPGVVMAAWVPGEGAWYGASGQADLDSGEALNPSHRFEAGAITQSFLAATALLLADAGTLDLDAPLDALLPELPHTDQVTLRQCLAHTSGYADYSETEAYLSATDQPWEPSALIALVADAPLMFEPGAGFSSSATNAVVAALALEAATGRPYAELVHDYTIDAVRLQDSFLPSADGLPSSIARGYRLGEGGLEDVSGVADPSGTWAAGELVADSGDLLIWAKALFEGDLLPSADREHLVSEGLLPEGGSTGYGLGCELGSTQGLPSWGQSGEAPGYRASMVYLPSRGMVLVTLINQGDGDIDALEQAAWAVLLEE